MYLGYGSHPLRPPAGMLLPGRGRSSPGLCYSPCGGGQWMGELTSHDRGCRPVFIKKAKSMFHVGDKVTVQGVPGSVIGCRSGGTALLYLVCMESKSVVWMGEAKLIAEQGKDLSPTYRLRAMEVGHPVTVQGAPGIVAEIQGEEGSRQVLSLISTPTIRWLTEDQLVPVAGDERPERKPPIADGYPIKR